VLGGENMNFPRELQKSGYELVDSFEQADVLTEIWLDGKSGLRRVIEWAKVSEHTVPAAKARATQPTCPTQRIQHGMSRASPFFRAMLGGGRMNDEIPSRHCRDGPREIQEMLVEWEHVSPVCSRLKLREWG
jgi:hypothetical protein